MVKEETLMRKAKSIIALIVILLLLCGAYYYVSKHPKTSVNSSSSPTATTSAVQVWKADSAKVSKIIITYSGGANTFVKNAKEWNIENYAYKLDQAAITSATDPLINLSLTQVEKSAKDMDKYGLSKPLINAKIVGDVTDKILLIGDKTPDGSNYYASEKGKNSVYFISTSIVESLTAKQAGFRDKTITTIDPATLLSMKIITGVGSPTGSTPIEITRNTNQSDQETQSSINSWIVTGPYSTPRGGDDQKISSVTASIAKIKVGDIIGDDPKDLSVYGLDKPSLEVILKDSKNTLHLIIGKDKDANSVYFKTAEVNTIYTMEKAVIDTFKVKPLDVVTITSKVNDKSIELSKFKIQYQEMIGLSVDAENDKKLEDKPEISMTYTLNKGSKKQEVVDFVPYDGQFYAVFRDGKSDFVITKEKVSKMITDLKNLK